MNEQVAEENTRQLKTLYQNLKRLRERAGLSIPELSRQTGIRSETLHAIENGADFPAAYLFLFSALYHIRPQDLFQPLVP